MTGEANQALELAVSERGWRCQSCGWVGIDIKGQSARNEGLLHFAEKHPRALIAEVERLTQERDEARSALESVRDFAVAVERQNHDALEVARDALSAPYRNSHVYACQDIVRLLETENQ